MYLLDLIQKNEEILGIDLDNQSWTSDLVTSFSETKGGGGKHRFRPGGLEQHRKERFATQIDVFPVDEDPRESAILVLMQRGQYSTDLCFLQR